MKRPLALIFGGLDGVAVFAATYLLAASILLAVNDRGRPAGQPKHTHRPAPHHGTLRSGLDLNRSPSVTNSSLSEYWLGLFFYASSRVERQSVGSRA
jgi:hypothetical protein